MISQILVELTPSAKWGGQVGIAIEFIVQFIDI